MGSSSSKSNAAGDSPPSAGRRNRSYKSSRLRSICSDGDNSQISENRSKGNCSTTTPTGGEKNECYEDVKAEQTNEDHINSDVELDSWHQSRYTDSVSRVGNASSSRAFSSRSSNPLNRFLPRLSFSPGNISFRLIRANILGSHRAPSASPRSFVISNYEDDIHFHSCSSGRFVNRSERSRSCDFFPACFGNGSSTEHRDFASSNTGDSQHNRHTASGQGLVRDNNETIVESDFNMYSPENYADGYETRLVNRRSAPVERNIQFSRTLSVGRLRDRVLRRSTLPEFCPFHQEVEVRHARDGSRTQDLISRIQQTVSEENGSILPGYVGHASPGVSSTSYQSLQHEVSRATDAMYHEILEHRSNVLEHRSNMLEMRRRIRSQLHALRRLGSRFENFSGHSRSCNLSGQHRLGHCTCRMGTREANSDNRNSARASISRIVMLAEALFEVLDEIHQQSSVVFSSQPSVSSIGSLPAPNDVVESLPVKAYRKSQRHSSEDSAQCYICLVDYDEGDSLRMLPCRHEFHRSCVDKWLKEIHRVCPLCRGDICRSKSSQ